MSTELHILSDKRLDSIAEWQRAIDEDGFPVRLSPDVEFESANGFLPVRLRDSETGFECYHDNARETLDFLGRTHFDHDWGFALGFRLVGSWEGLISAWMAASAYARATDGIVFDHEQVKIYTPLQAHQIAYDIEGNLPAMKEAISLAIERLRSQSRT